MELASLEVFILWRAGYPVLQGGEGYEHLFNTSDRKWRDWVMEDDVVASIPGPTNGLSCEEIAAQGMFGLYARREPKRPNPATDWIAALDCAGIATTAPQ